MFFPVLRFGHSHKFISVLKRFLNELVHPNPNLPENDEVDKATFQAIRDFRIQWFSKLRIDLTGIPFEEINFQLWAMIGKALYNRKLLLEELQKTNDREVRSLLLGVDFIHSQSSVYSPEMETCDEKIAKIFGGKNAVAAANGFDPESLAIVQYKEVYKESLFSYYRGDTSDSYGNHPGHLSAHSMHLYGSKDGTRFGVDGNTFADLYVPDGFGNPDKIRKVVSPTQACVDFYYKKLGNSQDVTLVICHIKNFKLKREGDRWRVGQIGGKGGDGVNYIHSHFRINKGDVGLTDKGEIRLSFSEVFC